MRVRVCVLTDHDIPWYFPWMPHCQRLSCTETKKRWATVKRSLSYVFICVWLGKIPGTDDSDLDAFGADIWKANRAKTIFNQVLISGDTALFANWQAAIERLHLLTQFRANSRLVIFYSGLISDIEKQRIEIYDGFSQSTHAHTQTQIQLTVCASYSIEQVRAGETGEGEGSSAGWTAQNENRFIGFEITVRKL